MFSLPVRKILSALLSGFLLTAAFPAADLNWTVWFALIPLLTAIKNESPAGAFKLGIFTGLAHFISLIYWIINVISTYGGLDIITSTVILLLLCLYLSIYTGIFAFLVTVSEKSRIKIFLFAGFWVSLEYIRTVLFTGFPWCLLGYSQYNQPILIQVSDITGVYGISFMIAAVNILLFLAISDFRKNIINRFACTEIILLAFAFILMTGYGKHCLKKYSDTADKGNPVRISVIQGNIDQSIKWDTESLTDNVLKYLSLTRDTFNFRPDIIIWPETAVPFPFQDDDALSDVLYRISEESRSYLVFGNPAYRMETGEKLFYNSAICIAPDGRIAGQYDKAHLVPFGEYVPLKNLLPFVHRLVPAAGDFSKGKSHDPVKLGRIQAGLLICYEAIFPEISRKTVNKGASILINMTNDAWFGFTSAPYQHFYMAAFRAVENRRHLIRSANTGFSGIISPSGRIMTAGELFTEEAITENIRLEKQAVSFYSRYGDLFALAVLILCTVSVFFKSVCPGSKKVN